MIAVEFDYTINLKRFIRFFAVSIVIFKQLFSELETRYFDSVESILKQM